MKEKIIDYAISGAAACAGYVVYGLIKKNIVAETFASYVGVITISLCAGIVTGAHTGKIMWKTVELFKKDRKEDTNE